MQKIFIVSSESSLEKINKLLKKNDNWFVIEISHPNNKGEWLVVLENNVVEITKFDIPSEKIFLVKRFNGSEKFKIEEATWNLYKDDGKLNLCFYINCEEGISLSEEIKYISESINWELNLVEKMIEDSDIKEGFKASIPKAYDENRGGWLTNLYFASHGGSEVNNIKILKREGDKIFAQITGEITDINYYDGSKPNCKLVVQTWFIKDSDTVRSMD